MIKREVVILFLSPNQYPNLKSPKYISDSGPQAAPDVPDSLPSGPALKAFPLFGRGLSVERVAGILGRKPSTVYGYLAEYVRHEGVTDPSPWVDRATAAEVQRAAATVGSDRLKPIYEQLGGRIPYEQIRVVVECLRAARRR
ncbi:MAG TPA: hypothetical protein EYP14_20420 [Planctomycetaceae bacterium]|nr:hypothetical protein [Planctomycetaceae bacterium]